MGASFFPFEVPVEVIVGDVLDWKVSVDEKTQDSDDALIQYQYRYTQLNNERVTPEAIKTIGRNDVCSCGNSKNIKNVVWCKGFIAFCFLLPRQLLRHDCEGLIFLISF